MKRDDEFYAVAELGTGRADRFALVSIHPSQRIGTGCRSVVISLHQDRLSADAALAAREGKLQ